MESALSERARALSAIGAFSEALNALRAERSLVDAEGRGQVLLAEMLERTGDPAEAGAVARRLLAGRGTTEDVRARCLTLLGTLSFEAGHVREAVSQLNQAVGIAAAAGASHEACWAKLRLFLALSHVSPPEAVGGLLTDLRRHVARIGDTGTTIALHLFVAEIESQRGIVETAQRHVKVGNALLDGYQNYWLEGLAAIDSLCLAYISSDPDLARKHAERAIALTTHSGHVRSHLAAISNLGHIELAENRLKKAEQDLKRALSMCRISAKSRASVLDGLAQLEMARGAHEAAQHYLDQISLVPPEDLSYAKLWSCLTQGRLWIRVGSASEAATLADATLKLAQSVKYRQLSSLLLLLRAEARACLDDPAGAGEDIVQALAAHDEPPVELLAEAQRVLGRALALGGDTDGAAEVFGRSARILRAVGHLRAEHDVRAEAARHQVVLAPADEPPAAVAAMPPAARPELLVQRAAAVVEQAARPDLLGAEMLGLLASTCSVRAAAVLSRDTAGALTSVSATGWTAAEAEQAAAGDRALAVPLGRWRDREWLLAADVYPHLAARAAWIAIRALATSGVALAAARREAREREALWPIDNPDDPSPGVFICEQMLELLRVARRIASTQVLVLLTGETGVGKEIFARIIHDASSRAAKPFVPFNCSAVPREMLESQLFGHRRGAFTGADQHAPGVIRAAAGGTLFLDEIGEVALDVQPKLLRFLELGEIHPLGEPQPLRVDVRVVAATNRDLDQAMREGRFREDLYYRLNVIRLHIPPLRERREEIPGLVDHFLTRFARENQKGRLRIADETMEYLVLHAWPGNVRQLMNELRRMAALAETDAILMPEHLHRDIVAARRTRPASERDLMPTELVVRLDQPLAAATEHLERAMIQHAMTLCEGRVEQVARTLGLSRKGLYLKRQRLGIGAPAS